MLLPFQNGMAAFDSLNVPAEAKQVCPHMVEQAGSEHQQMQAQVGKNCCDKDSHCQQQCNDCVHCPATTAMLNSLASASDRDPALLHGVTLPFPDSSFPSLQLRPPQA
ncbi:MAG: hypothetical protein PVJ63_10545 [Thioalkalispiraceae bacterium]